jgi:hypothetical protein
MYSRMIGTVRQNSIFFAKHHYTQVRAANLPPVPDRELEKKYSSTGRGNLLLLFLLLNPTFLNINTGIGNTKAEQSKANQTILPTNPSSPAAADAAAALLRSTLSK